MKITLELELTEEDLQAGNWAFSRNSPEEKMTLEDMIRFHLKPALHSKLHTLRSKMRW